MLTKWGSDIMKENDNTKKLSSDLMNDHLVKVTEYLSSC